MDIMGNLKISGELLARSITTKLNYKTYFHIEATRCFIVLI
jgi:hypothetical protein